MTQTICTPASPDPDRRPFPSNTTPRQDGRNTTGGATVVSCDSVAGDVRCESGSSGGLKNNFDTKLYISESGEYDCSLAGL